jgi:hypothetical protein
MWNSTRFELKNNSPQPTENSIEVEAAEEALYDQPLKGVKGVEST